MCQWCEDSRKLAAEAQVPVIDEETMQAVEKLAALRRRIRAGDYAQDRIGDKELLILHRLSFQRWLYRQGKLSEGSPPQRDFDSIMSELLGRPVTTGAAAQKGPNDDGTI